MSKSAIEAVPGGPRSTSARAATPWSERGILEQGERAIVRVIEHLTKAPEEIGQGRFSIGPAPYAAGSALGGYGPPGLHLEAQVAGF